MLEVHCCGCWRPVGAALLEIVQVVHFINMRGLYLMASPPLVFDTLPRCPVDGSVSPRPASCRAVERCPAQ